MNRAKEELEQLLEGVIPASKGAGPLLQRDYWGVIRDCRLTSKEVASLVRDRFLDLPPESLVKFKRAGDDDRPLDVGDEFEIKIRMAATAAVRVVHLDDNSLTLATLEGHPEAGRITFGAYPNERGDVVFHIRSRARSSSSTRYAGFMAAGEPMQTNTWTDFIDRLAHMVGDGVVGVIRADTQRMEEEEDEDALCTPTFVARGD